MQSSTGARELSWTSGVRVVEAFETQVQKHPDSVAVVFEGVSVSYRELDRRANAIAGRLSGAGAGREILVATLLDRSAEMISGLLGILKTGAAFLPIDPSLPAERIRFILEDSCANILLTERKYADGFGNGSTSTVLMEDAWRDEATLISSQLRDADPDDLAYVIYTSGSTGAPKGVEVLHRGLSSFLASMRAELEFTPQDVMAALSSPSFDISVMEIFLPLVCGGTLAVLPRNLAGQGESLRNELGRIGATVMLATPSTWQLLVNSGWKGNPRMRAISGGEAIAPALAHYLAKRTRGLWNHYGPTEATIAATTYRINGSETRIPIGQALPYTTLFVLDEQQQPVEPGTPGELYIAGVGVARGYRNRPELTAQRFVTVDIPGEGAIRLYKTGDVVRMLPDGNFEFTGRLDNQIKIRGFRVELEEIEAVLAQHSSVRENVVLAQECGHDDRRLVAYVVPSDITAPLNGTLRAFLQEKLPAYMIPSKFVPLSSLPMTSNGKIDRQSPLLREELSTLSEILEPAQDEVEAELLAIWRGALGFDSIGVSDNFFEIGGHSFLAAKLVNSIEKSFDTKLPISVLFEAPTIRQLAQLLREGVWSPSWSPLVAIRKEGSRAPLFCVHPIGGNVLSFQALSLYLDEDQPVYGLQARGLNGQEMPHCSIEAMAADYIEAVRGVQSSGPYLLGGYSAGGLVAFEMARQLMSEGETVSMVTLFDSYVGSDSGESAYTAAKETASIRRILNTLGARVDRFQTMSWKERADSIRRNFAYFSSHLVMDLRIRRYMLLRNAGFKVKPLRNVDDAFALAVKDYQAKPMAVDATLFRAAKSDGDHDPDPTMGWGKLILGDLDVRRVAGDHFTILYEPYVRVLARELGALLETTVPGTFQEDVTTHRTLLVPLAASPDL